MPKALKTWLFHQCRMLPGVKQAVLLTGPPGGGRPKQALFWPEKKRNHSVLAHVARAALNSKQAVIKNHSSQVEQTGEPLDALACPLFVNDRLFGIVAMEVTHRPRPMQKATLAQVQTGVQWLATMLALQVSTAKTQLVNLVDLIVAGLEPDQFKVAATRVVSELAKRFSCERVSLGFLSRSRVRVLALSHGSQIDPQSNLAGTLQDAMTEALDQGTTLVYPPVSDDGLLVTRFHARLAGRQPEASICTVPLTKNGKPIGALLLERTPDKPFGAKTAAQCEQIGLLLGPVLEMRRQDERLLPLKLLDAVKGWIGKLLGPRHLAVKAGVVLSAALLIWLSLATTTFRISIDSVLEAGVCRAIVAPQKGYIAAAHVRAGDLVRKGDLLATLDDRELLLERRKWQSQRGQLLKEYRQALAGSDRSEIAILKAKRDQAEAQLNLVEHQLERIHLVAPFSGLIVKGDLRQALGSPVERGEVLYEISPTREYRVVMKVDDRDIGLVAVGQRGQLKLSGIPDRSIGITTDRLTPVTVNEEGRHYFRVEAVMDGRFDLMRPGMEGIAKIEVGREKLLWIWTRELVNWGRLFVWNRLP